MITSPIDDEIHPIDRGSEWYCLPEEIQIQILSYLDADTFLAFSQTSSQCASLCRDQYLSGTILARDFPITAARVHSETLRLTAANSGPSLHDSLQGAALLRNRILKRQARYYYELSTKNELPVRYAQNLGQTPRSRHHSRYNFNRLALYFTGQSILILVDLRSRAVLEIDLPQTLSIRDVFLEDDCMYVLTTRYTTQYILRYDMQGKLLHTLDTQRADLIFVMANERHTLAYAYTDSLKTWISYSHTAETADGAEHRAKEIPNSAANDSTTQSIDDHFFYQMHNATGLLTIYDLDSSYCVSRISMFAPQRHVRSEVYSINRHCYLCGPGQIAFVRGLDITKVNVAGIPHDDDTPIWDSRLLVDVGGWVGWFGDAEEGVNFGAFCVLPADTESGILIDCGRLRGPGEPEDQYEVKSVKLHGDQNFLICVMDGRVLVWQLQ